MSCPISACVELVKNSPKLCDLPTAKELRIELFDALKERVTTTLRNNARKGLRVALFQAETCPETIRDLLMAGGYSVRRVVEREQIGSALCRPGDYVVEW